MNVDIDVSGSEDEITIRDANLSDTLICVDGLCLTIDEKQARAIYKLLAGRIGPVPGDGEDDDG